MKNIVFDVGKVLLDWNPQYLFDRITPDPKRRSYLLENVITQDWIEETDKGKSIAQAVAERVALFPDYEDEIRAYFDRWHETIPSAIQGTVDILEALLASPHYKVWAITNFGSETWVSACQRFPFLTKFEGVVVSADVKQIKPDPEIYKTFFTKFNLEPTDCIFIDDRLDNVQTAEDMNMKSIQFKNPEQLKKELSLLGVKIETKQEPAI